MVNYTCQRFLRTLRSTCAPFTAIVGFSCLLTFIFILYQPSPGPGLIQQLGWQSWDTVGPPGGTTGSSTANHTDTTTGTGQGSDIPEGVDWWTSSTSDNDKIDFASLPLDKWAPLMPHDTGLSEIAVTHCLFNPARVPEDICGPPTSKEQDAINGKWVRVERNLNFETGYLSGYLSIYYRRTRRQDVKLITNITILPENTEPWPVEGWQKASTSLRTGWRAPPLFLWYHATKSAAEMTPEERDSMVTEIDILFGDDTPWYGFEKLDPPTLAGEPGKWESTRISIRRGVKIPPRAPPLHFSREGKFKILQVADLHYSVSVGECRDVRFSPCSASDNLTSSLLSRILDVERPDLVVFTGDQLNGQDTSWDPKSVLAKFAKSVTDRKIPWAAVFGNHDAENGATREDQMKLMQGLPYSLVESGPKDVHGVGNYVLKVRSADPKDAEINIFEWEWLRSKTHILTLYFLDSGAYSKGVFDWFGFFRGTEYDWIRQVSSLIHKRNAIPQEQIDWFLQESSKIDPIERPFHPDGATDLGNVWRRQEQITPQTRRLAKPNALMFFHIPLPEAYDPADRDPRTNWPLDVGLKESEAHGNAKGNDGFFEKGLLKAMESDHVSSSSLEVKAIANGHCHITENCRRVKGIWMCFGGGGSYSGYGKVGFDRRFRIYDISDYGETITTYKRTEADAVINELVLAGQGAPPL
ncbi:Phosphatase dcr2 [Marasmius crinis-equi]|uniref:Phosphatase dcr2 n=1 Tax=Marasmius crinis-equi TaxID=585013 RepID=A0ABR3F472_9AGAR